MQTNQWDPSERVLRNLSFEGYLGRPRFMGVGVGGKNHENASPVINPEFPALLGGIVQGFFIDFGSMTRFWVSGNKF